MDISSLVDEKIRELEREAEETRSIIADAQVRLSVLEALIASSVEVRDTMAAEAEQSTSPTPSARRGAAPSRARSARRGPNGFRLQLASALAGESRSWTVTELSEKMTPEPDANYKKRVRGALNRMVDDGEVRRVADRYEAL